MENFIKRKLEELRLAIREEELNTDDMVRERIISLVFQDRQSDGFSAEQLEFAVEKLFYKTRCALGILQPLMENPEVTEIMVNGQKQIFIEEKGRIRHWPMTFDSTEELEEIIRNIAAQVHREINEMQPIVDARLADGSRISGVYRSVAVNGPILTIRKFSERFMTMESLIEGGTIPEDAARLLACLTGCGFNIFISGGTSSGKTTFLNALADFIPREERVIVIEDSSELKLASVENIVHLECRSSNAMGKGLVTMSSLIKASLRMRPDRIVVGEVRGGEVLDMLQAMNTGHSGSMSTGHGNSVEGMLRRLETMYMMAMPVQTEAVRAQIGEALDLMVHVEKLPGGIRRVVEITEICGYEAGRYELNVLYRQNESGRLVRTGNLLKERRKILLKGGTALDELRTLGFLPV